MAGRSPMRIGPETGRMGLPGMRFQLAKYSFPAVDRPDVPGQGQYIAPMAVEMKERLEQDVVAARKSLLERREPMVRNRREGLRFGKRGLGCHGLTRLAFVGSRSEEHTSELQSRLHLVCRLLLEKKKKIISVKHTPP